MIISASRRTDIPAFFSSWFFNRIKEKYVLVRNPKNFHQISKIDLSPEVVDCIVFWTKNPKNMINNISILADYNFYFQYTLTAYGKILEPHVHDFKESVKTFLTLSDMIGPEKIIWRYDPIIITDQFDVNFHKQNFQNIIKEIGKATKRCVISFVDLYETTKKNLYPIIPKNLMQEEVFSLVSELKNFCEKYNMAIFSCAENIDLSFLGVLQGKCIDEKLINEVFSIKLQLEKDKNQRPECGCVASIDIGAYNTCPYQCRYCYANADKIQVKKNFAQHNINSPLLIGFPTSEDSIIERKVLSCKIAQKSLFDTE